MKLKANCISHKVRQYSEISKLKISITTEMKTQCKWEDKIKTTPHSNTDKNKLNITYYKYQKKEHYVNKYSDKDFNLNKLSVLTVSMLKKDWVSIITSHY